MPFPKQFKVNEAIVLRKTGLSYNEIGERLGVSGVAIWKRLKKVKGEKVEEGLLTFKVNEELKNSLKTLHDYAKKQGHGHERRNLAIVLNKFFNFNLPIDLKKSKK
jgi:HTH domain.